MILDNNSSIILATLSCMALSSSILAIDISLPLGVAGGVPYVAVVLVSLRTESIKYIYYTTIFCSLLTIIGYFYSPQGGELWKVALNRALALFAIWVTAILSANILVETQKEIKTLRGFIPICTPCKKIRDDKGYWNQIEAYIDKHTEAKFSHGICPDCMKKLYPDYAKVINGKNNIT
jgi:hypothetical protein